MPHQFAPLLRHQRHAQRPGAPQRVDDESLGVAGVGRVEEGGRGQGGDGGRIGGGFGPDHDVVSVRTLGFELHCRYGVYRARLVVGGSFVGLFTAPSVLQAFSGFQTRSFAHE